MKAKNLGAGISLVGASLFILLFTSALPGPAAAQGLSLGPPHFPPAARPLLKDIPAGGIGHNFQLIDHNPLIAPGGTLPRGGNGFGAAIVRNCFYASSGNNSQGTLIVDISNPRRTKVVGEIPPPAPPPSGNSFDTDAVAAVESENLLLRNVANNREPMDGNKIELFDTTDCFHPQLVSTIELPNYPHDGHSVWQGGNPHTVLLFVYFSGGRGPAPPRDTDLRVYDITNKASPRGPIAEYSMQRVDGLPAGGAERFKRNEFHNVTTSIDKVSPEGFPTQLYVAARAAGFFILDSTAFATQLGGGPPCDVDPTGTNPCIKKLNPDFNARLDYHPPFIQSHTHSAHKVPGRPYVVLTDEPGPCPWSWVRFVFVDDQHELIIDGGRSKMRGDLFPSIFGAFTIPENLVENCAENEAKFPGASFNSHWSLVFRNLMFISWIAGGVRAIDFSNPGTPFETGFFFNKPVRQTQSGAVNPELGIASEPMLKDGLLYFLDRTNGLYVLQYTGPRKEELPEEGLFTSITIQVPGRQP